MGQFLLYIAVAAVAGIIIGLIWGMKIGRKRIMKKIENYVKKEKISLDLDKLFKNKQGKVVKEDFFEIPSE